MRSSSWCRTGCIRSRSVEGLLTYISSWELEPVGDDGAATRVTYRMGFKLPPSLERLATRFFNLDALTAAQGRKRPAKPAPNPRKGGQRRVAGLAHGPVMLTYARESKLRPAQVSGRWTVLPGLHPGSYAKVSFRGSDWVRRMEKGADSCRKLSSLPCCTCSGERHLRTPGASGAQCRVGAAPGLQRAADPRANGRGYPLSLWLGVHGDGD